ncbi:hypothetical protein SUGI_1224090 [Cryptomeria japonica]|uniref:Uncharacterized protein n=1 Tax=Cryptomeria japonica TaxID=3369 RepID=A0AAD3NMU2_CRYJA|nr:hypothetical protein SUGI_1224090 [Cryptomeria japonica]
MKTELDQSPCIDLFLLLSEFTRFQRQSYQKVTATTFTLSRFAALHAAFYLDTSVTGLRSRSGTVQSNRAGRSVFRVFPDPPAIESAQTGATGKPARSLRPVPNPIDDPVE